MLCIVYMFPSAVPNMQHDKGGDCVCDGCDGCEPILLFTALCLPGTHHTHPSLEHMIQIRTLLFVAMRMWALCAAVDRSRGAWNRCCESWHSNTFNVQHVMWLHAQVAWTPGGYEPAQQPLAPGGMDLSLWEGVLVHLPGAGDLASR